VAEHQIRERQVYEPCDRRGGSRIRIDSYVPYSNRATVSDAATGKRFRQLRVTALHGPDYTGRSGYRLVQDAD
jgi:hypothetical protein